MHGEIVIFAFVLATVLVVLALLNITLPGE